MKIKFTHIAEADIKALFAYIAQDDPTAARETVAQIERAIKGLAQYPHLGHEGRREGTRELVIPHTPYFVVYQVTEPFIYVVTILHEARRWT